MEAIKVIDNAMETLKPLIDMLEVQTPYGNPDFSDMRIAWWDDEVFVTCQKRVFSVRWIDVKKFGRNDVSLSHFEYHRQGNEYFINLFPEVTLFIPVIEIDTEDLINDYQIVKLLPGQACIMPVMVIHALPFQNQKKKGIMLVLKRYELDYVPVSIVNPLQFQIEV